MLRAPRSKRRCCVSSCPARQSLESLEPRLLLSAAAGGIEAAPGAQPIDVEMRAIDGRGNNAEDVDQGAAETNIIRFGYPAVYPDGHGDDIDNDAQPNPRDVSNSLNDQIESVANDRWLTDWIVQWGQFVTHDMVLTLNDAANNELSDGSTADFSIAINDPHDPLGPNPIPFNRSDFDAGTGTPDLVDSPFGPRPNWREQINSVTSYIDASNVYGSDEVRAAALRTFVDGKLELDADGLLPLNTDGLDNDDPLRLGDKLYLAGDIRANEQVALTALHTVFVREHNRLADAIHSENPGMSDEQIYQLARRIVGAEMQIITYREFLPALLGSTAPNSGDYQYDPELDASITNSFAAAIFRFGHSMQSSELQLVDGQGDSQGTVSLAQAFFNPDFLGDNPHNVDFVLNGLSHQVAQENDLLLVDEIRNFLFGPPGAGGMDLAALDIQRGRDHGLPDYNSLREFYGLQRVSSFSDISDDPQTQQRLQEAYGDVDSIDAFIGALAEDHLDGASVGELVQAVVANQFARLRDGDRFFFEGDRLLQSQLVRRVIDLDQVTLGRIIQRNTGLTSMQENVFYHPSVLYYRAGRGSSDVRLTRLGDTAAVIDRRDGHLVDSRSIDELTQIILVGTPGGRPDRWVIDASLTTLPIPDGIVIQNGGSTDGVLTVRGKFGMDSLVVDHDHAVFNAMSIRFSGLDVLRVVGFSYQDQVLVREQANVRVVVESERGCNPGHGQPDRRSRSAAMRNDGDHLRDEHTHGDQRHDAHEQDATDSIADHDILDHVFQRNRMGAIMDRSRLSASARRNVRGR